MKCKNCGKETTNPSYCSRSCAATVNNRAPKRKRREDRVYVCPGCGGPKSPKVSVKMCRKCATTARRDKTIGDVVYSNGANKYNHIRGMARTRYAELYGSNPACVVCGYDKHIHVCHRIPIKDFDHDTHLSVVNGPKNLVGLCPNCHWEFDNGLIDV